MELFCWLEVAVTFFRDATPEQFFDWHFLTYVPSKPILKGNIIYRDNVSLHGNLSYPYSTATGQATGRQKAATCPLQIDKASIPGLVIYNQLWQTA